MQTASVQYCAATALSPGGEPEVGAIAYRAERWRSGSATEALRLHRNGNLGSYLFLVPGLQAAIAIKQTSTPPRKQQIVFRFAEDVRSWRSSSFLTKYSRCSVAVQAASRRFACCASSLFCCTSQQSGGKTQPEGSDNDIAAALLCQAFAEQEQHHE